MDLWMLTWSWRESLWEDISTQLAVGRTQPHHAPFCPLLLIVFYKSCSEIAQVHKEEELEFYGGFVYVERSEECHYQIQVQIRKMKIKRNCTAIVAYKICEIFPSAEFYYLVLSYIMQCK